MTRFAKVATIFLLLSSNSLFAAGPCKDKVQARHAARKLVHECLESWAKDGKADAAEPTDNCTAKLESFIQAAKDVKACRTQAKK